jgi:hypothetical protein
VGKLQDAIDALLQVFRQLANAVAALLTALELWLRGELQRLGVPPTLQTLILLAVAVVLVLGTLRLLGGLVRVVVILILLLLAIHILMPVIQG